jgi:hypothetical protein
MILLQNSMQFDLDPVNDAIDLSHYKKWFQKYIENLSKIDTLERSLVYSL